MIHYRNHRRGLATLELVLALPILLLLMALMVNFGVIASWKVRGSSVARFEAFQARHERAGYGYPRPESWWPAAAAYGHNGENNISIPGGLAGAVDSSSMVPTGSVTVITTLLDTTRGVVRGYATLTRGYAMLGKMGNYDVLAETHLIDDKWQYHEMGLNNDSRRSQVVYMLPTASSAAYVRAATNLFYTFYVNAPYATYLAPLDRDPEYIAYRGSAPDFHPRLSGFCTLDKSAVDEHVQNLIDRIQGRHDDQVSVPGLAERMTQAFISLYNEMIRDYQGQIDAAASDPNSPVNIAALQAAIATLRPKIATLEAFLKKLQDQ